MMKSFYLSTFLGLLAILSACGPSPQQLAQASATDQTATAAAWTSTPVPTAKSTDTPLPTQPPTLTPSPTLTLTPTTIGTTTPTPTATLDPNRYYAPDLTYSLVLAEGWKPEAMGLEYPALVGPIVGQSRLDLGFIESQSTDPLAFFSAQFQDSLKKVTPGLKQISEDFLNAADGSQYFRWAFDDSATGTARLNVVYIFESGNWKLVVAYNRPADQGSYYDNIVDEMMKTVRFTR